MTEGRGNNTTGQQRAWLPRCGDVVYVSRPASVQFVTPFMFRIIRVHDWPTYEGWVWLDGYQLDRTGDAVERRTIFVQIGGLRSPQAAAPDPRTRNARTPVTQITRNRHSTARTGPHRSR